MNIQTRSQKGQLTNHQSMNDALNYANEMLDKDPVQEISYIIPKVNEKVRLIKTEYGWILQDVYGNQWHQ